MYSELVEEYALRQDFGESQSNRSGLSKCLDAYREKTQQKNCKHFGLPTVACIFNYKLRAGPLLPKTAKKRMCESYRRRIFYAATNLRLEVVFIHLRLLLLKIHQRVINTTLDAGLGFVKKPLKSARRKNSTR
jgi:hypothetical protein